MRFPLRVFQLTVTSDLFGCPVMLTVTQAVLRTPAQCNCNTSFHVSASTMNVRQVNVAVEVLIQFKDTVWTTQTKKSHRVKLDTCWLFLCGRFIFILYIIWHVAQCNSSSRDKMPEIECFHRHDVSWRWCWQETRLNNWMNKYHCGVWTEFIFQLICLRDQTVSESLDGVGFSFWKRRAFLRVCLKHASSCQISKQFISLQRHPKQTLRIMSDRGRPSLCALC